MKKRFLSLMIALAMMVGVFTPLIANAANDAIVPPTGVLEKGQLSETKPDKTEIELYKLTTKESYKAGRPWEHTGGKIADTKTLGTNVEPLKGAKFTFYKIKGTDDKENEKILALLDKNKTSFETVTDMDNLIKDGKTGLTASDRDANFTSIDKNKLEKVTAADSESLTDGQTGETDAQGKTTLKLADGYYWAIESHKPDKVTGAIAVPFGLTLPLMNGKDVKDGDKTIKAGTQYLKKLYIYPKNIQTDNVQIDKDHANYDDKTNKWVDKDGKEVKSEDLGINYTEYQREKKSISEELGKDRPFQSDTTIPRNYTFEEFSWSDVMSEGLTYNKGTLKVTIDYIGEDGKTKTEKESFIDLTAQEKVGSSMVTERSNGFDISVKKADVKNTLVKYLERGPVTFHFNYSAKVNNKAVVDKPQTNSITFEKDKPNGGGKVKSKDKSIEIEKTWKDKDGKAQDNAKAADMTYYLAKVENGEEKSVASVTVKAGTKENTEIPAGKGIKFVVGAKFGSGKFTGLPDDGEYVIREAVNEYKPTYTADNTTGKLTIENKENPDVKKPSEPKVVFHGKKFVKVDQLKNEDRLFGAEFVVRRATKTAGQYEYLVVKNDTQKVSEVEDVKQAKKNLDDKIAEYNKLSAKEQTAQKSTYDTAIAELQKKYNDAVIAARTQFTWGAKADAYVLVSDDQGRFEITGLKAGEYELEEITAPAGYALNEGGIKFNVKDGSYTKDETDHAINYNKADAQVKDAFRVDNKKVTIPQTGGIGTIIFTAIGLAIMASAVIAIKKRQATEAR
ncbi:MAG: pilin N-terminal domain-containing protein [Finegoldia magna]|nr:pilin N-terminal domain-containing protein [Finegoldia magna]MDU5970850.1 pilin N-terminal domain-containing protein [Finegoldia magna]